MNRKIKEELEQFIAGAYHQDFMVDSQNEWSELETIIEATPREYLLQLGDYFREYLSTNPSEDKIKSDFYRAYSTIDPTKFTVPLSWRELILCIATAVWTRTS